MKRKLCLALFLFLFSFVFLSNLHQVSAGLPSVIGQSSDSQATFYDGRKLARAPNGDLYMAWNNLRVGNSTIYVNKSTDNGATWTSIGSPHPNIDCNNWAPSIAIDSTGRVFVAWHNYNCLYMRNNIVINNYTTAGGWGTYRYITTGDFYAQEFVSIAIDSNDVVHATWQGVEHFDLSPDYYFNIKYANSSSNWKVVNITLPTSSTTTDNLYPVIAIDGNNVKHIAWNTERTSHPKTGGNISYVNSTDWSNIITIVDMGATYQQNYPSILTDTSNIVHLAWQGQRPAGFFTVDSIRYANSTNWSAITNIDTVKFNYLQPPSIARDSNGNLYILWHNSTGGNILYSKYTSSWSAPAKLTSSGTNMYPTTAWARYPSSVKFDNISYAWTVVTGKLNPDGYPFYNITFNNVSEIVADIMPPTFSNYNANTTAAGAPVNFSTVITDNVALSGYIFETNNTGRRVNYTWTPLSSGGTAYNITRLNSTVGSVVNVSFYANDTSNNWAVYRASLTTTSVGGISNCVELNQAGTTYVLASSFTNTTVPANQACINITANNITFNCQGFNINTDEADSNSDRTSGIGITRSSETNTNITVKNCDVTNWWNGIYLANVKNNTLRNNAAYRNWDYGIVVWVSSNNTLINNTAEGNGYGIWLESSSNNTLTNNILYGNLNGGIDLQLSSNNNILRNNTADFHPDFGIYLSFSSNNILIDNTINSNGGTSIYGIVVWVSSNNTLINNTANDNDLYGIKLISSSNNILIDNTASNNNYCGIGLYSSDSNTLTSNTANNNDIGISISQSSINNTITGGSIHSNTNDYDFFSAGTTNNFTNTNFTAARKIYFYDATSWFNYNNQTNGNIWLKTNVSAAATMTRNLANWSQTNMSWNEYADSSITANYTLTGLLASRTYTIYSIFGSNRLLNYTQSTGASGVLIFNMSLNTTARMIMVNTTATIPSGCEGYVKLSIQPTFAPPSSYVEPSAYGLSFCEGKTVYFWQDTGSGVSCTGKQVSSCTVNKTVNVFECIGNSFPVPPVSGPYTYYACIDMNSDGDFGESGEQASLIYTVGYSSLPEFGWMGIIQIMILASVIILLIRKVQN